MFSLDDSTTQNNSLCVDWSKRKFTKGLFKVYTSTKSLFESQNYKSVQFVEIKKITSILPNNLIGVYLRNRTDKSLKRINSNILEDNQFHFIDEEGNLIGKAPILTFNELFVVSSGITNQNDESEYRTIVSSFKKELLSKDDRQKSVILKYLTDMMYLYNLTPRFYAPFVTICQSSGVGKSRLILECGEDIPLIYGVFRSESDKSYPAMSHWIKMFVDYVLGGNCSDYIPKEGDFLNMGAESYSMGRVLIFIDSLLEAFKSWYRKFISQNKTSAEAFKKINAMFYTFSGQAEFSEFIKIRSNKNMFAKNESGNELEPVKFKDVFDSIGDITKYFSSAMSKEYKDAPFVIVFDELSLLLEMEFPNRLNLFHIIRRALHLLQPEITCRLLIVGIGTNVDVSLLHKEVTDDSLRYVDRILFLPSLILGSNWDIFKNFIDLNGFKLSLNNVKNTKMIKLLCSFGRALWSSLPFGSIMTVAKTKLRNGSATKLYSALAIWSIRTGLSLNSDMVIARTLLRSYMAIAYSISYDSETMNIGYPSEPVLALAARNFIKKSSDFKFNILLQVLLEFVQLRPIDKGEITEAIFTQIVLIAIDKAKNAASIDDTDMSVITGDTKLNQIFRSEVFLLESVSSKFGSEVVNYSTFDENSGSEAQAKAVQSLPIENYYHITTVESFLLTLYGETRGKEICDLLGENLRNGIINATHAITVLRNFPYDKVYDINKAKRLKGAKVPAADNGKLGNNIIDQAILRNLFMRQALLKPPARYYGLDLCIPVLMKRTEDENGDEEGIFGYIGLQFKSNYESESTVIPKMNPIIHYVQCPVHKSCSEKEQCPTRTSNRDISLIYKNHLLLYMSANHVEETNVVEKVGQRNQGPRNAKITANNLIRKTAKKEAVSVGQYKCPGNKNVSIPYFVTRSIAELSKSSQVLDQECCSLIQAIIHAQNDPFKNAENFQSSMVAENVLTMSPLRYSEADGDLRASRGMERLPDPFFMDESKWSNPDKIKDFIDVKLRNIPAKKTMKKWG